MAHIFCIVSQKGGVGKTTTALSLGLVFASRNKKVLIIDADPQGGIVYSLDKQRLLDHAVTDGRIGLYQVFCGEADIPEAARHTDVENLDIVDCGIANTGSAVQAFEEATRAVGLFREAVQNAAAFYDVILMDCPPGIGSVTVAGVTASDYIIIPLQCEPLSLRTLPQLLKQLLDIKKTSHRSVEIAGLLITMFDRSNPVSQSVADQIRLCFNEDMVFAAPIPRDPSLNLLFSGIERLAAMIPSMETESPAMQAYQDVAREIEFKFLMQPHHAENIY
jgi:chromosome partitioning protein